MEITISRVTEGIAIMNQEIIEVYKMDESITFSKFIELLLSKNLEEEITLKNTINDPSEAENELVNLVTALVADYNLKVIELADFIKTQNVQSN
ncbi:MAG: hypothetical protein A2Y45_04570 [Tenericutes bacterium GWC2_34_14]|jgi:hypothetical protein|nr:MAG: hypothetical protein A2Z84_05120 [Tenericutes bacterium GWA2_35_7]OHE29667.1 MAG: hypothetical protein A2Y45_04570 [Tenericutes bacterium GWC2_34_14]OHE33786.1 MAG: hypothetical protein A2012_07305 [Tenericutes bacterium GWE2_34_108]OHE36141.1 MAG: hypothetical protein A2Y46_06970 [Tenericutes bacterium GWF1_35_14]OHE37723.1 MAG: hypothetical protein A2Y44_00030 [Tenericutes bacterium GWF2_35_184]OHE41418.1 MAG: hypothetical protein A3K26_03530 [Tenericutes bacterium RIFOXYA12_FULL_35_